MARYPMHWHVMGAVDGQYFTGSSVWGSFNRCVTVHGTDNARVEGNVCHDHLGHGYFLEDGAETGNLIAGNLGLGTQTHRRGRAADRRPRRHLLDHQPRQHRSRQRRGRLGRLRLLVRAAGVADRALDRPARAAAQHPAPRVQRQRGAHQPARRPARGRRARGRTATTETVFYAPRTDPADANTAVVADFTRFTAYKHPGRAVWLRGRDHRLSDAVLADNAIGATFASSETFVEDALFVGESANNAG